MTRRELRAKLGRLLRAPRQTKVERWMANAREIEECGCSGDRGSWARMTRPPVSDRTPAVIRVVPEIDGCWTWKLMEGDLLIAKAPRSWITKQQAFDAAVDFRAETRTAVIPS